MQEYKVILTWEAVYDIAQIAEYIETKFGRERADQFQYDIQQEIEKLGYQTERFPKTQLFYRNYAIHKKPFSPSIIFYVTIEFTDEIHVLRVLREERNWEKMLEKQQKYTYPE